MKYFSMRELALSIIILLTSVTYIYFYLEERASCNGMLVRGVIWYECIKVQPSQTLKAT